MTGSIPLTLLFAAAAAFSLYELARPGVRVRSYLADTEAHAAHFVMNAAMAAMYAPIWSATAERIVFWALTLGIVLLGVRFAVALRRKSGSEMASSAYHAVAMAAMIYAIVLMPMGHAPVHHHGEMARPVAASILSAIFALDAVVTLVLAFAMPGRLIDGGAADHAAQKAELRRSALPHVVMDAGMVLMLI